MRKVVIAAALSSLALLLAAPSALAGDTQCVGVVTGAVDNVVVPPGANCSLTAQVKGNVKNFGQLQVFSPTTIRGSVDGEPGPNTHTQIFGAGVIIRGNLQIKGQGPNAMGYLSGTTIGGDVSYLENRGFGVFNGPGSTIGGNLKAEKNTGGGNISGNTIRGNVECKENTPPFTEGGNAIGGDDKCPE